MVAGFNLTGKNILFKMTQLLTYQTTSDELVAERGRPGFGTKLKAWRQNISD